MVSISTFEAFFINGNDRDKSTIQVIFNCVTFPCLILLSVNLIPFKARALLHVLLDNFALFCDFIFPLHFIERYTVLCCPQRQHSGVADRVPETCV